MTRRGRSKSAPAAKATWPRRHPNVPAPVTLPEPAVPALPALSDAFELAPAETPAPRGETPPAPLPAPLQPEVASIRHRNQKAKSPAAQVRESFKTVMERTLSDPQYQQKLVTRLLEGRMAPNLEALIVQMVVGRPPDAKDATPPEPVSVRIVHEFPDASKS